MTPLTPQAIGTTIAVVLVAAVLEIKRRFFK